MTKKPPPKATATKAAAKSEPKAKTKPSGKEAAAKAKPKSSKDSEPRHALWCYAAAAACRGVLWEQERDEAYERASGRGPTTRRPKAKDAQASWELGDEAAWWLVLIAREGVEVLTKLHVGDPLDAPPEPAGWESWEAEADRLFELAGIQTNFTKLVDRSFIQVTPYHVTRCADPKHPMYDRRWKKPPDRGLAESILQCKEVVETLQVTPHEDEDGMTRLYSGSGSRRTQAARLANDLTLQTWMRQVRVTSDDDLRNVQPPALLRGMGAKVYLEGNARTVAATVANQGRLGEDLIRQAESVEQLVQLGYSLNEVAARLMLSGRTVSNLHSLNKLDSSLRDALEEDRLAPVLAYRLATEPSKKRQKDAFKATEAYKTAGARKAAIEAFLANSPLPSLGPKPKVVGQRSITAAAERLQAQELDEAHRPLANLLAALAGDEDALKALPPAIRSALIDPKKITNGRARWEALGFDEDAQRRWQDAHGAISAHEARTLESVGVGPDDLALEVPEGLRAELDDGLCLLEEEWEGLTFAELFVEIQGIEAPQLAEEVKRARSQITVVATDKHRQLDVEEYANARAASHRTDHQLDVEQFMDADEYASVLAEGPEAAE